MPRGPRTPNVPVGAAAAIPAGPEGGGLKRAITPALLLFFIVGDILGGGIYARVGQVAGETGGAIWIAFLLALLMAAFTAGSYAELVGKYPRAGGAGLYVHRAFGHPFISFVVAFAVVASGIASASALARAFGGDYLSAFVDVPVVLTALVLVGLIAAINLRGIEESVKLNVGFTLVEMGGLVLIVIVAAAAIFGGDAEPSRAFESRRTARCSAPRWPARRSRSTPWSASRTPSTSPRRPTTPRARIRRRCSARSRSRARCTCS